MAVNTQTRRANLVPALQPPQPGYSRLLKGSRFFSQITLSPFTNKRAFRQPTLIQVPSGGSALNPFSYFVAGVDRTGMVDVTSQAMIRLQVNSKGTASFRTVDVSGGGYTPTENDEVKIYEGSTLIFQGNVDRTQEERLIKTAYPRVVVTCSDAGVRLSRRVVNAFYSLDLWGSAYFIVPDLIAKHAADMGITYVRDPADNDLELIGDQLFYCMTFTEAMNQLAKAMDADWTVDVNLNLYFVFKSSATVNSNAFTDSSGNWLEVQATRTLALEGNRIFAKSSAQLLQTFTDTFPGNPLGIYVMSYPPRDATLLPEVTVNGTPKTVVSILDAASGVPYDFFRVGTVVQMNMSETPLSSSDTVEITVPSPVPYVAVAEDSTDIATNGLKEVILECGNITSKSELQAIADAWLSRLKERATQLTIKTAGKVDAAVIPVTSRSWMPGQAVSVNFGATGGAVPVVDTFLVDSVDSQIRDGEVRFMTLTLSNQQYQRTANPAKFIQDIIARLRTIALPQTQVLTLSQDTNLGTGFVLNVDQQINLDSSNGPFTVTLPAASELYGKQITFKKVSGDSSVITVQAAVVSGKQQNIDGQATQTLTNQFDSLVIAGNQWQ